MFTSPGCKYCEVVKKSMPIKFADKIEYCDCTLPENETIVAYHNAFYAVRKALPVLVVDDELFVGAESTLEKLVEMDKAEQ